ncbi:FAD synthetase family protein [Dietzia lutea]|nr:FAD synthetase family protein [Dietzia lutea]
MLRGGALVGDVRPAERPDSEQLRGHARDDPPRLPTVIRIAAFSGEAPSRPRTIACGVFDGVHRGHQAVISGCDTVVTFDRHPRGMLAEAPPRLATTQLMRERLAALAVREIVLLEFDSNMRQMPPDAFASQILARRLQADSVRVGSNFRFGKDGAGRPRDLGGHGFAVEVQPLVEQGGTPISSSTIRSLVSAGEVERARQMLGCPHEVALISPANPALDAGIRLVEDGHAAPATGRYNCLVATAVGGWVPRQVSFAGGVAEIAGFADGPPLPDHALAVQLLECID